jgi:hypothetical protein
MASVDSKIAPIKTLEWDESSLISKVELREQGKGQMVAYVHAAQHDQEDYPKLFALREAFKGKGWATSSDNHHGKAVLRVTGIANEQQLTDLLKSTSAVQGPARVSYADVAGQSSKGAVDFVKSNSSRLSGLFYLVGDALMIARGFVVEHKNLAQMGTGISFAVGDIAFLAFGGKDDKRQFKSLLTKLKGHLEKEGVEIPQGTALTAETLAKSGGVLEKTYDFLHEHINPIKISTEILGGYLYQKGGKDPKDFNADKITAGRVIMAGWLAALLIPEKKRDPDKWEQANPLEKAAMFIQEKPLRLAGAAGLIHNGFTIKGALKHRNEGVPHYQWDLAAVSSMLVANSLYAICSKSTGGNIKADALVNDVYGIAAQILNRQPEAVREAAINSTVEFLGERPEIKDTKPQIAQRLRDEIEMQSQNPWFKAIRQDKAVSHAEAVNKSRTPHTTQTSLT